MDNQKIKEKKIEKEQTGLSTSDIIKMSEEIGADWLEKQSEEKIGKNKDDSSEEKKGKLSNYSFC